VTNSSNIKIPKIIDYPRKFVEGSEIAKRDHQRNKSEIVKLVKEMFGLESLKSVQ